MVRSHTHSTDGNGSVMAGGKKFQKLIGTRAEVMHGTAYKTSAGKIKGKGGDALTKAHLKYNKHGRIVSRAKSAKKGKLLAQLRKAGYTTKKGSFGAVKVGSPKRRTRKKSRKARKGRRSPRTRRCRHRSGKNKGKFKKC